MPPVWDPKEQSSKLYQEVENPSKGVVTVRYRPPSDSDLENLQSTEIYRIVDENSDAFGLRHQIKKSV
ncbi:MAG TPA: hypothetical protein VOA88_15955 [Candidatus Dormibacteraeota bacterium]|nr:hypothetical protein [Candidatus Dormibacteraeota bacterium]